jgi:SAM-dependent methyltransferase
VTEPALWGLRRRALDLLHRLGLARPAVRVYELLLAAKSHGTSRRSTEAGGLPLPPARLRAQAGPRHADAAYFLQSGREHAELIRGLLRDGGSSVEELQSLLDWGCGCGRVLRHWSDLPDLSVNGCDVTRKMVAWCRENLPFAHVTVNELEPPLPYGDASFDLVYAFSVMTHLPEELQHSWMRELLRVLKPDGFLLISTLGEYYLSLQRLNEAERQAFARGEVVVLYDGAPGTSLCSVYHPREYVQRTLAADFDVVAYRPAADAGRHDLHLLRKPAPTRAATGQP